MQTQPPKTKQELAEAVRQQADLLKEAVKQAEAAGLQVKFFGNFIGPIRTSENPFGLSIRDVTDY